MRKTTDRLVDKIEHRMNTLIAMEASACGHELYIEKADHYRTRLLRFMAKEIDKLCEKAGLE